MGVTMAKCKTCGKSGIFLRVDKSGNCPNCAATKEKQRVRDAYVAKKVQQINDDLSRIPRHKIIGKGRPIKKRTVSVISDVTYSRVTAKSNPDKLGRFVVIDTETTGLSATKCEIIEVAAIKYENFKPIEAFHTLVKPKGNIPEDASRINGIHDNDVRDAPLMHAIIPDLQEFILGYPLVGHNLEFDLKFLYRAGLDVLSEKRKFYDTMKIAETCLKKPRVKWDKELGEYAPDYDAEWDVYDYKLETLCEYFNIFRSGAHRALGDCYDAARLFQALFEYKK